MNTLEIALACGCFVATLISALLALAFFKWRGRALATTKQVDDLRRKYAPILEVETHAAARRSDLDAQLVQVGHALSHAKEERAQLQAQYAAAKGVFESLRTQVSLLEENLENISFGVYKPHFDFDTSEEYKRNLDSVYDMQKALIKAGGAVNYGVAWTVGNSKRDGERMQKQYGKLLLRAFNGECDACVAKVTWNNATRMEERIRKSFESINDLGLVMQISIMPAYMELRLQELRLHHELEEKRRAEQEEQRRLREQLRDEERAQRELDRAREEAEQDENRHARAIEKARKDLERAKDEEARRVLDARILELEAQLEAAHAAKERAISRAQMTRAGHVYIISNVGSFGDGVLKIGMTRRLEPRERVKELGDASVPFEFDVHGMAYSDDAPTLEAELHREFANRRVNLVNHRREFFRVQLEEVEAFMRAKRLKFELSLLAEAREYRETQALRNNAGSQAARPEPSSFPAELFESTT